MPNDTTIPADAIAGLLDGWVGPAEFLQYRTWYPGVLLGPTCGYINRPGHGDDIAGYSPANIRLNCLRPEVQDRIGRVLAAGVRCPHCFGGGVRVGILQPHPLEGEPCANCAATGWSRKPSPIHHILGAARTNALSPQHIAEAVAWSVRSVARGGEVLRWVYDRRSMFPEMCDGALEYRIGVIELDGSLTLPDPATLNGGALVLPGEKS